MTKDDSTAQHLSQDSNCDDFQPPQQQKPFQVVLVDIKEATFGNIRCVEKPLEESAKELNFVALSYRWGEVQETVIDTHLGYIASITSFDLEDFCLLCCMMTHEPDLKSIKYVWVDAICVDQTNHERRKATIYQMTNIYEKATYILAVPDLHRRYLTNVSSENKILMEYIHCLDHREYIYHLIQQNIDQLHELDNKFLNEIEVPEDRTLRQLLAKYTTYLANGFTTSQKLYYDSIHPEDGLDFLCEIYRASLPTSHEDVDLIKNATQKEHVNAATVEDGPSNESSLDYIKAAGLLEEEEESRWMKIGKRNKLWTYELIKRKNAILQTIRWLEDLIVDWASRVWVISEYHIAKKKNNMKYCFIQLSIRDTKDLLFFNFDFTNPAFSSAVEKLNVYGITYQRNSNPVHLGFHHTMINQLTTQTFFEMMLKSKATKNEDRFYAILPNSKYQAKANQVADWKISNLMSVKLKLFEIMDTRDKWIFLFLSGYVGSSSTYEVLPTFCSSNIYWGLIKTHINDYQCNFDINNETSAITLHHSNDLHLHYLQLTPKHYYVSNVKPGGVYASRIKNQLCRQLQLDDHSLIEIVCLPENDENFNSYDGSTELYYSWIELIGSFEENKWILRKPDINYKPSELNRHVNADNRTFFNLY
ncbi:hypothetical protein BCR42DRAFT_456428 [Absidia repens]|uniref:Heterokaryon incompatibility domain-containing protein n=1 Tax=Absidia repens TaxID=90262 RepID=A0A1X2I011_9FUNG|nr:hypothetical protein BCR42DRAFT_456428 [Absidia repens]